VTQRGAKQIPWTPEEIAAVRAGAKHLPGRSNGAIRTLRLRLRVQVGDERAYSQAELTALMAGARTLPGRNGGAVFQKRKKLGLTGPGARPWSPEERTAVEAGAMAVPGRSYNAVIKFRQEHGLSAKFPRFRPWTPDEVRLLDAGEAPPARSEDEIRLGRLTRIGLAPRPVPGVPVRPAPRNPEHDRMARLYALVPPASGDPTRAEIVSEAMLLILEEGLTDQEAVREARRRLRRFYNPTVYLNAGVCPDMISNEEAGEW
jgi:hypothetical protein